MAENSLARKANKKDIVSTARQTVQFSEDARALAAQRQEEERIANEKAAAAAKAKADAEAKAAAEAAEAKRKADEEARRQAELASAREAQLKAEAAAKAAQAKAAADAAAAKAKAEADAAAARAKAEADTAAARAAADAAILKAKEEAAKADAERARKAAEDLRAQLLEQFNRILETKDTPRGLIVTMGEVLFETGKYDIKSDAREKLARLSGIILAHPGLNLAVEGHTDNTGGDELNQKLSEQRAGGVREYLVKQGLADDSVTAKGFGKTMPAFDNSTADGRRKNRRVEIIVSGEVIGARVGR
jgi:outer membrane protein OmpA-like peptidoglycan-associated protein